MSSLARALAVLDLFAPESPTWSADEINAALGYSRATGYRYVKDLVAAGLLQKTGQSHYALGARIIELDWQLRCSDPVLQAAAPAMEALAQRSRLDVVLTAMFGGNRIVDTHRARYDGALELTYGRGRPRPLFRGAAAKVLIAALPPAAQKRLYERHAPEIVRAGGGDDWPAFRAMLAGIRDAGVHLSLGELEKGIGAAAVPLRDAAGEWVGALALVGRTRALKAAGLPELQRWLDEGTREIRTALSRQRRRHPS